jgi:hypothetical protein
VGAFVLGVLSSLVASAIAVVAGSFSSKTARRWLVAVLSRLTGVGVERTYSTQKLANVDLAADLACARSVKVLTGRGNELTRDSFHSVWNEADSRLESVQILLPNPDLGADSWLAEREKEVVRHDLGFRPGLLAEQIRANIGYLRAIAGQRESVEIRLYDLPIVYRVIVTDRLAYITLYEAAKHGRNSPCLVFRNPSPMYDFALRLFSTAWTRAIRPAAGPRAAGALPPPDTARPHGRNSPRPDEEP